MPTLVTMPKWGLTMTAGTVTGWIASEGEEVTAGAPLLTVETEKAVNDVEAPADGVLRKIVAAAGSEVPVSGPVAVIVAPDEAVSDDEIAALVAGGAPVEAGAAAAATAGRAARGARAATRDESGRVNASPAARKRAQELGIDLAKVEATGPNGRITSDDVERAAAAAAAEASAPTEEVVPLADGRRLSVLLAGPPKKPPLVFLHGLGGSSSSWSSALAELAPAHRVAAVDLPGHGRSDKSDPATTDYTLGGLAGPVAEALETLGLAPAILVGHSLGAAVAIHLALERPKLVAALVLVDAAGLGEGINPELLDRVEAEPSREEARRWLELFFADQRLVLDRGVEEIYRSRLAPGADAALRAIAAACFNREGQLVNHEQLLEEIAAPTLIVWGDEDRVIPVKHGVAAADRLEHAWLEVLEGIGHVPQVEAPAAFAAVVAEFARAQPAPAPSPDVDAPAA